MPSDQPTQPASFGELRSHRQLVAQLCLDGRLVGELRLEVAGLCFEATQLMADREGQVPSTRR
jgi:hypothetical protein